MKFTITCNSCDGTNVGLWDKSRDGEYVGKMFKCEDCGEEETY